MAKIINCARSENEDHFGCRVAESDLSPTSLIMSLGQSLCEIGARKPLSFSLSLLAMFIALVGTRSSGKSTIRDYLVAKHGFRVVKISSDAATDQQVLLLHLSPAAIHATLIHSTVSRPATSTSGTTALHGVRMGTLTSCLLLDTGNPSSL
jgi:hypothetical protein